MVINTSDMENILKMTAMMEYFIIHRTIKLSSVAKERYSDTRHHMEQSIYSDALPVMRLDRILISLFVFVSVYLLWKISLKEMRYAFLIDLHIWNPAGISEMSLHRASSMCCLAVKWCNDSVLIDAICVWYILVMLLYRDWYTLYRCGFCLFLSCMTS